MKKILLSLLFIFSLLLASCSEREYVSAFDRAVITLDKTGLAKEEYPSAKIDIFEKRFVKMNLEKGFSQVIHYRSTEEYVYLIEFYEESDAAIFFEKTGSSYDIAMLDNAVAYGDCDIINKIAW